MSRRAIVNMSYFDKIELILPEISFIISLICENSLRLSITNLLLYNELQQKIQIFYKTFLF